MGIASFGCLAFLSIGGVIAIVLAIRASLAAGRASVEVVRLREALELLVDDVAEMRREKAAPATEPAPAPMAPAPVRTPVPPPTSPPAAPPVAAAGLPIAAALPPAVAAAPPSVAAGAAPSVAAAAAPPAAAATPPPGAAVPPPGPTMPPPPSTVTLPAWAPPPPRVAPPRRPAAPIDWERLIVKLASGIAGVAFVLAIAFFLKYSVEHGWLSPMVRASIGIAFGVFLLVICELKVARNYRVIANALDAAGIAILYVTLYAIRALWHLLPAPVVFALMLVVTAVAVGLSLRRDSVFIAMLGLLGGFATPALVSTGQNDPIGLFGYLLVLNAGLAWVAYRKRWPLLTALSVALTVVYEWMWVGKFLDAAQMPLAAAIFVVMALVAASALWMRRAQAGGADGNAVVFERIGLAGTALPLLFALFAAAVPAYGARFHLLFGFLFLVVAGLLAIAALRGPRWLAGVAALAPLLVFAVWLGFSYTPRSWPLVLGWIAAFIMLLLAASVRLPGMTDAAAALMLFPFPVLVLLEPRTAATMPLFAVLFVMVALLATYAVWRLRGLVYYTAALFAITTQGAWSARHLTEERLIPALCVYGAFALLLLGVPIVARRFSRALEPHWGTPAVVLGSLALLFFLAGGPAADAALWGVVLLLVVLNAGAVGESRAEGRPYLAAISMLLSWIVLAVWWGRAEVQGSVVRAVAAVGLFGVVVVAGSLWRARGVTARQPLADGVWLGLAGHLFLFVVAAQPGLSLPPWPMFAVLAVLDLALGVAALMRRPALMGGALLGSQVVLGLWAWHAGTPPWPGVALAATVIVAAFGLVWWGLGRRVYQLREEIDGLAACAAAGLFAAQVVATIAGANAEVPKAIYGGLLATHVVVVVALLAIAWIQGWHRIAVGAVALAAIATGAAGTTTPGRAFAFALALYLPFVAYPLLLGVRAKQALYPYLAAVLASVPFFFFARDAIVRGGGEDFIGALPVAQAILLLVLVLRLVRSEPAKERNVGRLALVAGAALGFITLAVPLQLDKQWITIAWALEGAALAWLFRRVPHRGLLWWSGGLMACVAVRLLLNSAVLSYFPSSGTPILNWYLYTYLVAAASFYLTARLFPVEFKAVRAALATVGTVLLFALVNIEIADFYSKGGAVLAFNFLSSSLAQDLTYTICWALFSVGLLIAGIALGSRYARIAAVALLAVTVLKCFLHDLARFGGLYRVGSLLGLAMSLVLVGVLLQKFVLARRVPAAPAEAEEVP